MSDTVQTDTPVAAPVERASVGLSDLSPTQRDTWLKTGELPQSDAPVESETPQGSTDDQVPSQPTGETPPVEPEKVAKPPKPRDDTNARFGQLTEQRRQALERAEAAERRAADLEARLSSQTPKPASPNAPPDPAPPSAKPTIADRIAHPLDSPMIENDTQFWMEYPDATVSEMSRYFGAYESESRFAQREHAQTAAEITKKAEANVERTWAELKAEFPDADPSSLRDLQGQSKEIFAQLLFESPISAKLLNYFSRNPAEARSLAAMEPLAAAHALGKVESSLSTPAPSRIAAPTKTVSTAPDPPQTLGNRHTPNAGDEVEQALRDKDTGRYIEAENRRELAAMKAGRR